jgi:putative ABC transport system ATP-binding protein
MTQGAAVTAHKTLAKMRGVTRAYTRGGQELVVLDRLDLDIASGEFLALMGPSGSGKSTILNLLGGLDRPDQGTIEIGDVELSRLGADELAAWRARNVGFVFQSFNLIPVLTALENVELPLLLTPLSKKERREHARYALEIVGLSDRMDHRPKALSGGQEQRVAIARAVATDPTMVLADEPTGDLDRASADAIMDILSRLVAEHGKTIAMVTHDPAAAKRASRLLHLEKGVLVEKGTENGEARA